MLERFNALALALATVFVLAGLFAEASAQLPMTQVEGSHIQCPDADLHSCLTLLEQELIKRHSEIIRRDAGDHLSARLKTGRWLPISDGYALDIVRDSQYLALMVFGEEDISWQVIDMRTGAITPVEGYPLFSPDGLHMVSAESDEMNANFLDVYDVSANGIVRAFSAIKPADRWWPDHMCWIDNRTVVYMHTTSGRDGSPFIGTPEALALKDGKWRIEPTKVRCALTS